MFNQIIAKKKSASPIATDTAKASKSPMSLRHPTTPSPRGAPQNPPYQSVSGIESKRSALIGPGVYFEGTLQNCDEVIIDGTVKANIVADRMLVREDGNFSGTAKVSDAIVLGIFDGTLTASTKLTVNATGRVSGDIGYAALEIADGGVLTGDISVFDSSNDARPHTPGKLMPTSPE